MINVTIEFEKKEPHSFTASVVGISVDQHKYSNFYEFQYKYEHPKYGTLLRNFLLTNKIKSVTFSSDQPLEIVSKVFAGIKDGKKMYDCTNVANGYIGKCVFSADDVTFVYDNDKVVRPHEMLSGGANLTIAIYLDEKNQ